MLRLGFAPAYLLLALTGAASGQGENCSNPMPLVGLGTFAFDTTGFADSDFEEMQSCTFSGGPGEVFAGDGFFSWTAPASGDYQFVAAGFTPTGIPWNIQMAIYEGIGCSATCLQSDDNTGPNSQALIGVLGLSAGDQLLIQVGGYDFFNDGNPTVFNGPGLLTIEERPEECQGTTDDFLEDNDTCATALPIVPGVYADLFLSVEDPDFFEVTIPPQSTLSFDLLESDLPMSFFVYDQTCTLVEIYFVDWIRTNASNSPETIVLQPRRSNLADAIPCTTYSFELVVAADTCTGVADDQFEPNDFFNTGAPLGNGFYPGLFITQATNQFGAIENDYFTFTVKAGETVRIEAEFIHDLADINLYLLDQGGSFLTAGVSTTDDEVLTWHNDTGVDQDAILNVFVWAPGIQICNNYDLTISGLDGALGIPFCPAVPNSTGLAANLTGSPSSDAASGVHLEVEDGPPNQFGFVLVGNLDASPGISVSNGQLCLAGTPGAVFYRFVGAEPGANSVGTFDAQGVYQNLSGTSTIGSGFDVPSTIPGHGAILAGETWHFQFWHRDNAAGPGAANFSNGLSVTF